jgi:hypothetical protein
MPLVSTTTNDASFMTFTRQGDLSGATDFDARSTARRERLMHLARKRIG